MISASNLLPTGRSLHGLCNSDIGEPLLANKKVAEPDFVMEVNVLGGGVECMSAGIALVTGAAAGLGRA